MTPDSGTPREETTYVRIRVVVDGREVKNESYVLTPSELSALGIVPELFPGDISLSNAIGFAPIQGFAPGAGPLSLVQQLYALVHTPSVQIFIEGSVVGPALAAITRAVVQNVSAALEKRKEEKKRKQIKVTLYGPDGKEIDL
jgi:hypothetical protein